MRMSLLGYLLVGTMLVASPSAQAQQDEQEQAVDQAIQAARGAAGAEQAEGEEAAGKAAQIQAVDDLSEHYAATGAERLLQELERLAVDAEDKAIRREALQSLRAADAARRAAAPTAAPATAALALNDMRVISIECNGECSDITLDRLCRLAGTGFRPYAVDCRDVDDDGRGIQCGGGGDNRCSQRPIRSSDRLSWYCDDSSGWDANVYCAR